MARLDAFIERLSGASGGELLFQTAHGAVLAVDGAQRVLVRQALSTPQSSAPSPRSSRPSCSRASPARAGRSSRTSRRPATCRSSSRTGTARSARWCAPPAPARRPLRRSAPTRRPPRPPPRPLRRSPLPRTRRSCPPPRFPTSPARRWTGCSPRWCRAGPPTSTSPAVTRRPSASTATSCRCRSSAPLAAERLKAMLWTIAPEKNREECARAQRHRLRPRHRGGALPRQRLLRPARASARCCARSPPRSAPPRSWGSRQPVLDLCFLTKGLVLVTGPTGSGKSTTLAAMIDHVNRNRDDHIITIEDPVEFVHQNKQLPGQPARGRHPHRARSRPRCAPRCARTPTSCWWARCATSRPSPSPSRPPRPATWSSARSTPTPRPSTVDRIIDQFPADRQAQIRMMLAESLKGVIAQTLCKKIGGGRVAAMEILLVQLAASPTSSARARPSRSPR